MDDIRQNFVALGVENPKPGEEGRKVEKEGDEEFDEEDEQRRLSELKGSTSRAIGAESGCCELDALAIGGSSVPSPEGDRNPDFGSSSDVPTEVPVDYTLQQLKSIEFKDEVGATHRGVLASVEAQALSKTPNQLQSPVSPDSSQELSPIPVARPISGPQRPTLVEQILSPPGSDNCTHASGGNPSSSGSKAAPTVRMLKVSSSDGYNWRKYGQKQVKSPQGSRSYYKCTCSNCSAKKIECCNDFNCITEVIYKGQHSHDPPQKVDATRENRAAPPIASLVESNILDHPLRTLAESVPSILDKEPLEETIPVPESNELSLNGSDSTNEVDMEDEHFEESEPKRRVKKSGAAYLGSLCKPGKKHKLVVHEAGDTGISGDGYRWRKYGQKMVKGNPYPRNYYRCTSAGCPVRKQTERAVDSTTAIIITYKGIHDHDMPVPKKRHRPPNAPLIAAAAPASMTNSLQVQKTDTHTSHPPATKWSVGREGELKGEALELGGEKAMESARTLLSIGFEIKPC